MGQKLFIPVAVLVLVIIAGVAIYFILGDDSPQPEPEKPPVSQDDGDDTRPEPILIDPKDFDPAYMSPDPVKSDRPAATFTAPEDSEHLIISGRVVDEAGIGVVDARVTFIGEQALRDYTGNGYTDATGFYRLLAWAPNPGGTVAADTFGRIVAETPDGGLGAIPSTEVEIAGEFVMPDVEIQSGGTIEGQVLTEDGEPVPGAEVTVRSSGVVEVVTTRGRTPSMQRRQYVTTVFADATGHYSAPHLPRAEYRMHCQAGYFGSNTRNNIIDLSAGGRLWHEIRLPEAKAIRGVVVDQFEQPVAGAVVQLMRTAQKDGETDSGKDESSDSNAIALRRNDEVRRVDDLPRRFDDVMRAGSGRRVVTDAWGRFGFHAMFGDSWALVTRVGESEARIENAEPADSDYTLSITVDTSIGGIVRDAETGRVIEKFDVRIYQGAGSTETTPFDKVSREGRFPLRPGGEYSVPNPREGDLRIRVSAPGYAPEWVEVSGLRKGDQRRDLDVALRPLCEVTLELVHDGRKLDLMPVALLFDDRLCFASSTNELGSTRIPHVTPATYRVKVVNPDGSVLEGEVEVPPSAKAQLEVKLNPAS